MDGKTIHYDKRSQTVVGKCRTSSDRHEQRITSLDRNLQNAGEGTSDVAGH